MTHSSPRYSAVFCDVDGTIVDSAPGVTHSVRVALRNMGREPENEATLLLHVGPPIREGFLTVSGMSPADADRAVSLFREHYERVGVHEAALYPGIPDMLQRLRDAGIRLSTATSKTQRMAEATLAELGVADAFDAIVGATPERDTKSAVLHAALAALGEGAHSGTGSALLGDRIFDAVGARENGIDFVGAGWGYAPEPSELRTAVRVAADPLDAVRILTGQPAACSR